MVCLPAELQALWATLGAWPGLIRSPFLWLTCRSNGLYTVLGHRGSTALGRKDAHAGRKDAQAGKNVGEVEGSPLSEDDQGQGKEQDRKGGDQRKETGLDTEEDPSNLPDFQDRRVHSTNITGTHPVLTPS